MGDSMRDPQQRQPSGEALSREHGPQSRALREKSLDESLGWDHVQAVPDDHGLSLLELSRAYAHLLHQGDDPYRAAPEKKQVPGPAGELATEIGISEAGTASDDGTSGPAVSVREDDDEDPGGTLVGGVEDDEACAISPRSILEAMLFVGHPENQPLESEHVASLMRGVRASEVDDMVRELNELYDEQRCPYRIRSVGAGYRLELRDEFYPLRDKFHGRVKAAKLSQACIDALAIVAYHQPITREKVDGFRSRPSGAVLAQLVRRQLVQIVRTTQERKKVSHYVTTDRFLELFGLASLDELPQSQDPES